MAKAMARHILLGSEAEAARLKQRLAKGEVHPGQMVRAIDQVIFKRALREIHGPVKSQFGYHLVQVFYRD
ncbi:peptidylprolyl isomerase [Azotobacter armeniacus]